MRALLDTHILLWTAIIPKKLPAALREAMAHPGTELMFSTASLWEVAIKHSLGRQDFVADPVLLRRGLLSTGYTELTVRGDHALAVASLPHLHKDPFDRMLVAQAMVEGVELLTVDAQMGRYPGPIRCF